MLADLGMIGPQVWGAGLPQTWRMAARLITPLPLPFGVATHVVGSGKAGGYSGTYVRTDMSGAAVELGFFAGAGQGFPWANAVYPD